MTSSEAGPGRVTIVGSYLSPYVRKVLVCLDLKGIAYEIDPIVPFFGDDEFGRISPLRRIPVLIDEHVALPDSTVICEYLDECAPDPPLLPERPAQRARARWLEELADSRMGDVFIWRLFNQRVINRYVWGQASDEEVLRRTLDHEIPELLDLLEGELPETGFLFGAAIRLADVAIAAPLRNAAFARFSIDPERWPRAAGFVERVLEHPSFVALRRFEEISLRTPIPQHREALGAAGAPLTARTFGTPTPRRGLRVAS